MARNFPLQPIRDVVWSKGYSHAEFAELLGIKPVSHVGLAMRGLVPPNEELRRLAPEFLGVPLEELFTPDALAATCRPLARGLRRKSKPVPR
jgi:hypothetical protein